MAATAHTGPRQGKQDNPVAQDMIWKAHVKKEQETTKMWPENWGFLTELNNEPGTENVMNVKYTSRQIKVPDHMRVRAAPPLELHIKVDPSPAFPPTTQGLIGWRSTIPALQLECYGRPLHFKGDFCKRMNWPAEGMA
ncbi:protein C20orf85 homolog [Pristimantis euphronides]